MRHLFNANNHRRGAREHAYYLQYYNNKKSYVSSIWSVINWQTAEKRFTGGPKEIYGELVGLASKI